MKYSDIIWLQDSEAEGVLKLLKEEGEESALGFLSQWDYGESPIEENKEEGWTPWGKCDTLYKKDNYVMAYNTGLEYIGLVEIIEEKEH